ncbi:helix-turn-helix domain-containing protein [Bauldia sp.]|uniref:helix-turn-helix domain-containing protein n=1 Tax=Bauldia sp. TaxID=2575872 RepID=UPI003BA9F2FB
MLAPAIDPQQRTSLHITTIGLFQSLGGFRWEQVSNRWVLHCIRSGTGRFVDNEIEYVAGPGDVFLFQPGHHYRYGDDPSVAWRYEFVTFAADPDLDLSALVSSRGPLVRLGESHVFWRLLDDALKAYAQESLALTTACRITWGLLEAISGPVKKMPERDLGARVRDYVEGLDIEYPSVNELADQFGVDRATLFRNFRKATGVSVKQWIDRQRFQRAQNLLRVSDAPIGEVARLCGFSDPLYFSRAFRQRFGSAPSAWREGSRSKFGVASQG